MLSSRSNPVLADFRTVHEKTGNLASLARNWVELIDEDPAMADHWVWQPLRDPAPEHIAHAYKVLSRMTERENAGVGDE